MIVNIQLDTEKVARLIAVIVSAKDFTNSRSIYADAQMFEKFLSELLSHPYRSIEITDDPEE